jgi:hypothetical protein
VTNMGLCDPRKRLKIKETWIESLGEGFGKAPDRTESSQYNF